MIEHILVRSRSIVTFVGPHFRIQVASKDMKEEHTRVQSRSLVTFVENHFRIQVASKSLKEHTGVKPFNCHSCGKQIGQRNDLKVH